MLDRVSNAGVIVIGNEVLSAKVQDQNAAFLIPALRSLGVRLERVVFIRDEVDTIAEDVRTMSDAYTHVFTSGGVGTTHDDVTMRAIGRAFGVELVRHEALWSLLAPVARGPENAALLRMAELPEGAELVGGDTLQYPLVKVRNVYVFPGVPRFLQNKFEVLKPHLRARPILLQEILLSVQEHRIAQLLEEVVQAFPEVEVGSYPRFDDGPYKVKVTLECRDRGPLFGALSALQARLDPSWVVREVESGAPVSE